MKIPPKFYVVCAALLLSFCVIPPVYSGPGRLVVASRPGAILDMVGRIMSIGLSRRTGTLFILLDEDPVKATKLLVMAPPDGTTLMVADGAPLDRYPWLYKELESSSVNDFAVICLVAKTDFVIVVHPSIAAKSISELVAAARSKPGKLSYSSPGVGSLPHLGMELIMLREGIKLVHAPSAGDRAAVAGIVDGSSHVGMIYAAFAGREFADGKLRAIATTSLQRSPLFPDLPTVAESIPEFDVTARFYLLAPGGAPVQVIEQLASHTEAVLALPITRERLTKLGFSLGKCADRSGEIERLKAERQKWGKLIRELGIAFQTAE